MTEPAALQQIDRTYVRFRNRKLSYFSGCDYFRLASHPKVLNAVGIGLRKYGLNVSASRLTTGNHVLYGQLEERLADFFQAKDALLVASGYMTNLVVAQALARHFSHVLIDERSHPSLGDAARFLDAPVIQFKHRDPANLAATLRRCGPEVRPILLTDGMFSHDGSAAPLADYLKVLPKEALILVDDSHGAGVLGKTGQGTPEHAGLARNRLIQTVTLSKAFGAYGGAILSTPRLRQRIFDHSALFKGHTPLPLPLASAALQSVQVLGEDRTLRRRLLANTHYVKSALAKATAKGTDMTTDAPGPIIQLIPRDPRHANSLNRSLLAAGIYPPFLRYASGPGHGYFRFVISSEHSRRQLDQLVKVLICSNAHWTL
jgi:7-keto-8-aminopelargonate synthetase-like enzyme